MLLLIDSLANASCIFCTVVWQHCFVTFLSCQTHWIYISTWACMNGSVASVYMKARMMKHRNTVKGRDNQTQLLYIVCTLLTLVILIVFNHKQDKGQNERESYCVMWLLQTYKQVCQHFWHRAAAWCFMSKSSLVFSLLYKNRNLCTLWNRMLWTEIVHQTQLAFLEMPASGKAISIFILIHFYYRTRK